MSADLNVRGSKHPIVLYKERHSLTYAKLAKLFGVSDGTVVYRWTRGTIPGPKVMRRICCATRGEIEPGDFYSFLRQRLSGNDKTSAAANGGVVAPEPSEKPRRIRKSPVAAGDR